MCRKQPGHKATWPLLLPSSINILFDHFCLFNPCCSLTSREETSSTTTLWPSWELASTLRTCVFSPSTAPKALYRYRDNSPHLYTKDPLTGRKITDLAPSLVRVYEQWQKVFEVNFALRRYYRALTVCYNHGASLNCFSKLLGLLCLSRSLAEREEHPLITLLNQSRLVHQRLYVLWVEQNSASLYSWKWM